MRMRTPCILVLATVAMFASRGRAESLEEAWGQAEAVDQKLRSSGELQRSAAESLAAARAGRLPQWHTVGGYYGLTSTPSVSVLGGLAVVPFAQQNFFAGLSLATLPLYTSGRIRHTIGAAEAGVHAAEQDTVRAALDLRMAVAEAYVAVLWSQRMLTVAEDNATNLEAQAKVAGNLVKQAQRSRNDLLAAEVSLADAKQQMVQARNQLDVARAAYNRFLARDLSAPVTLNELSYDLHVDPVEALTTIALARRPELAALGFQQDGLNRQAKAVRAEACPQVGASAGVIYVQDKYLDRDTFGVAGLSVKLDLDAGITRHRALALDRQASAVGAQRADLETQIALQVRQAWTELENNRERIAVTRAAIDQAEENLRVVMNRYRDGVGTNTEVLDAHSLRVRTYANHYNAIYNAALSLLRLRRAVGDL